MKKLILVALATLPFLGAPLLVKPAAADVVINLSSKNSPHRSIYQTPPKSYPTKTWRNQTPKQVQANRRVQRRRQWVAGQWRERRENNRPVQRVWVPGHYETR
ncbi:MAG: hypothetical protein WA902_24240 [Thermosynechococcaceae cyanobacterium]